MDPFSSAISEYYTNKRADSLWLHNSYGEAEEMPVEVFFREEEDMPDLEYYAMELCRGTVLDIGAGTGNHSLLLQDQGIDVTALEINAAAAGIMKKRGIKQIVRQNIFSYSEKRYDTLLLLMNGIGLCGNLEKLRDFLLLARELLKQDGQILFDSSDVSYLKEDGSRLKESYFGEISYQYEYKNEKGPWFDWLYIDIATMSHIAAEEGWEMEVMYEDENDQYLGRLTLLP